MNTRTRILIAFAIGSTLGVIAGCQTYDFEPVEPLALAKTTQKKKVIAKNAKPNMMLLVDRSGSMHEPIDKTQSVCTGCASGVQCGNASCVTRWRAMRTAMGTFLTGATSSVVARYGLAMFPNATATNACLPGSIVQNFDIVQSNDVDSELSAQAARINQYLQSLPETQVTGGTPSANSLAVVGNSAALNTEDREDFVLLLTDGLPNCHAGLNDSTCYCVNTTNGTPPCGDPQGRQCLDDTATVDTINTLKGRGIRTVVIGFGADTSSGGAGTTLNKLAEAGGLPRNCLNDQGTRDPALCGAGETCDNTPAALCSTRFYKAADSAQLVAALQRISILVGTDPCEFTLNAVPSDPRLLSVTVNGNTVAQAANTWTVTGNTLTFTETGTICPQIRNATSASPVDVEIGIIETL